MAYRNGRISARINAVIVWRRLINDDISVADRRIVMKNSKWRMWPCVTKRRAKAGNVSAAISISAAMTSNYRLSGVTVKA